MKDNEFLYITSDEMETYKNNPEILKGIEDERSRDGIFSSETFSSGRKSDYLYTTEEEEERFRNQPEALEKIDMERALSHDGVTYKSPEEIKQERIKKKEIREKKLNTIMTDVIETIAPSYCELDESAELINPNKNATFDSQFVNMAKDSLINSTFYSTGNSGKYGNNFTKIEKALDSLNDQPDAYVELIIKMVSETKEKLSTDNYSDENYLLYVNNIIILSMIIEKGYKIDKEKLTESIGDFEPFIMDLITKINHILENDSKANQNIVPNPVNFVSNVSGSEYVDIRELGMQLIAAYNTNHRLSDDRSKYKKGKIKFEIPEGTPTINDIPQEFIKTSNYTRINGRYGYYTEYSSDLLNKKTFVVDELTGVISKIIYKQKDVADIIVDNPTIDEINDLNRKVVR